MDRSERKQLLQATGEYIAPFLRLLCLLPLRPGAIAASGARDFDPRTRGLTIGKDKNGNPRQIAVPRIVADFLAKQMLDKLPRAHLFIRADGKAWNKDSWKGAINEAATAAELPGGVTAYTLRHSVIADLIQEGLPILTVAQILGTSVAMIGKHYGHLVRDDAEEALAKLAI